MEKSTMTVEMTINGIPRKADVEPRRLLVHFLRDDAGLVGTHIGCDTSQCGACTVLVDGEAVKSCTMLTVQTDGADITTVEGLGEMDDLHPVQQGFWEKHGLQCGFCTPGVMMASVNLLKQNPDPSEEDIREGLEGIICRCTGYENIVRAVRYAADRMTEWESEKEAAAANQGEGR